MAHEQSQQFSYRESFRKTLNEYESVEAGAKADYDRASAQREAAPVDRAEPRISAPSERVMD